MKKTLLAIALLMAVVAVYLTVSEHLSDRALRRQGNAIIQKIERFRSVNGRLPSGLPEAGQPGKDSGPIYYIRQDDNHYRIWYGKRLGESGYYDSGTGLWDVGG